MKSAELKVVYTAPNRAHHYPYARDLFDAGILKSFVAGFPRWSPRSPFPELGAALRRIDQLQTVFIASEKLRLPTPISSELAYWAKKQMDWGSRQLLRNADVFLFYNGCGLHSARWFRARGGTSVVEAVNSHVQAQEALLAEEHRLLGLPWRPFHRGDLKRRVLEIEEADFVLLPSTFVARSFLAKGVSPERILFVPFPIQQIPGAAQHSVPRPTDPSVFRILFVGSISVRKGLRYLIEGFRRFKHPRKELWIVGPKTSPTGLENISVPDGVRFFGPLKGNALQEAYAGATVFCLPSIEEGMALVLTEAISSGLPVIATENTGVEDLLDEGSGSMVVPIRDPVAIAAWLDKLSGSPALLEQKRAEALAAREKLSATESERPKLSSILIKTFRPPALARAA